MPRGINQPQMAFIAPPDAAAESYTDLFSSPPSEKRPQRNSTGTQGMPPADAGRLQHSRSRSAFDGLSGSKRYIPSGPRPLASHLSLSSSSTISASSTSSFVQQPSQGQLSRSNSGGWDQPLASRKYSTPPPERSYVPRSSSSASISAGSSFLPSKSDLGAQWTALANPEIVTPSIGQSKEVGAPVAGPTVVPLGPSEMIWNETSIPSTSSFMGLFASKPQNSAVGGYDYDAHRIARNAQREEERERRRHRSGSQSDSLPSRSRSRHRDSPPHQGRQRTRPATPPSRSPSPATKTIPRVAAVPYPSQQASEMSYMFYDPELHGVGPPPPPPPALRALASQANLGSGTAQATSAPPALASTVAEHDPSTLMSSNPPPPRPPRRASPPRPVRTAQTDTTTAPRSAPPQPNYPPAYNYTSIHSLYMQAQPSSGVPSSSAYHAATPADFVQQGYYQAAAAPMIPLYSAPAAIQTHTLATSTASSPYYASAAPPTASSNTGARHTREPAYEPAAAPLLTMFATETPAVQRRSSSRHSNRENTTLERNTSAASTNYSYASTDTRTTQTSASSAAYTESSSDSRRRTDQGDSRPSTPRRWSDDTYGQSSRTGDSYTSRTCVSLSYL